MFGYGDGCGGVEVWRCGRVELVLRFPMEESIVEYQWSFPEVSPRPKSDGKAHGGYQIRSKSVECR